MPDVLNYAEPEVARRWNSVAFLAILFTVYPLITLSLLYGEWFLAWLVLGHVPMSSLDDPKYIPVSNVLHLPAGLAILGMIPAMLMCLLSNMIYVAASERNVFKLARQAILSFLTWSCLLLMLEWDPGGVMYWWLD